MYFALISTDKPHSEPLRNANRPDHMEYLKALGDRLVLAGPFLADDGTPSGSLIIIDANSRDEALAVASEDPYARADLFESVEIRPWNWSYKNPTYTA